MVGFLFTEDATIKEKDHNLLVIWTVTQTTRFGDKPVIIIVITVAVRRNVINFYKEILKFESGLMISQWKLFFEKKLYSMLQECNHFSFTMTIIKKNGTVHSCILTQFQMTHKKIMIDYQNVVT